MLETCSVIFLFSEIILSEWPALINSRFLDFLSYTANIPVKNFPERKLYKLSFINYTISIRLFFSSTRISNNEVTLAIMSPASTPLPETSQRVKKILSSKFLKL